MSAAAQSAPARVYRAMRKGTGDAPICGSSANLLGVRPGVDIPKAPDNRVHPGTGGLSVAPGDLARLPPHVRPPSHGGRGKLPIFELAVARLGASLGVRLDPKHPERHAFLEPVFVLTINEYQAALCATGPLWREVAR